MEGPESPLGGRMASTALHPALAVGLAAPAGSGITFLDRYKDLPSHWGPHSSNSDTSSSSDQEALEATWSVPQRRAVVRRRQQRAKRRAEKAAEEAAREQARLDKERRERLRARARRKEKREERRRREGGGANGGDARSVASSATVVSRRGKEALQVSVSAPATRRPSFSRTLGVGGWSTGSYSAAATPSLATSKSAFFDGEDEPRRRSSRTARLTRSKSGTAAHRAATRRPSTAGPVVVVGKAGTLGDTSRVLGTWDGAVGAKHMGKAAVVAEGTPLSHNTLLYWARHPELAPTRMVADTRSQFFRYHDPRRGWTQGPAPLAADGLANTAASSPAAKGSPQRRDASPPGSPLLPSWSAPASHRNSVDDSQGCAQSQEAQEGGQMGQPPSSPPQHPSAALSAMDFVSTARIRHGDLVDPEEPAEEELAPVESQKEAAPVVLPERAADIGIDTFSKLLAAAPSWPSSPQHEGPQGGVDPVDLSARIARLQDANGLEATRTVQFSGGMSISTPASTLDAVMQLNTPAAAGARTPFSMPQSAAVLSKSAGITVIPSAQSGTPVELPEPMALPPVLHLAIESHLQRAVDRVADTAAEATTQVLEPATQFLRLSQARHHAAVPIQAAWRSYVWRSWFQDRRRAATIIQCAMRSAKSRHISRHLAIGQRDSAIESINVLVATVILRTMRGELSLHRLLLTMRRCFASWKVYSSIRKSVMLLHAPSAGAAQTSAFRRWAILARNRSRHKRIVRHVATKRHRRYMRICLKSWYHQIAVRLKMLRMLRRHLHGIQEFVFGEWKAGWTHRRTAAIHIQRGVRGWKQRKRNAAATVIAAVARGRLGRLYARKLIAQRNEVMALRLQRIWRGHKERTKAATMREVVIKEEKAREGREKVSMVRAGELAREEALIYLQTKKGKAEVKQVIKRLKETQRKLRAEWDAAEQARLDKRERENAEEALRQGKKPPPGRKTMRGRAKLLRTALASRVRSRSASTKTKKQEDVSVARVGADAGANAAAGVPKKKLSAAARFSRAAGRLLPRPRRSQVHAMATEDNTDDGKEATKDVGGFDAAPGTGEGATESKGDATDVAAAAAQASSDAAAVHDEPTAARRRESIEREEDNRAKQFRRVQELRLYFDMFDLDGSGRIDRDELGALMDGALATPLSESELSALQDKVDSDNTGTIEFDEFAAWWESEGFELQKKKNGFRSRAARAVKDALGTGGMKTVAERIIISQHVIAAKKKRQKKLRKARPAHELWNVMHPKQKAKPTAFGVALADHLKSKPKKGKGKGKQKGKATKDGKGTGTKAKKADKAKRKKSKKTAKAGKKEPPQSETTKASGAAVASSPST